MELFTELFWLWYFGHGLHMKGRDLTSERVITGNGHGTCGLCILEIISYNACLASISICSLTQLPQTTQPSFIVTIISYPAGINVDPAAYVT